MKRQLLPSAAFVRTARRLAKRKPEALKDLELALQLLSTDAHHPALRTHKLKGKLMGSWAASAGYDLRIVFQFVLHEGTHDEVY